MYGELISYELFMLSKFKNILIGTPLPTHQLGEKRLLDKIRALAAFSPGALSSIAYANQEIHLGLVAAGAGERVFKDWKNWWPVVPLVILPSPYRSIVRPLLDHLNEDDR